MNLRRAAVLSIQIDNGMAGCTGASEISRE